jgi:hypothetical protein
VAVCFGETFSLTPALSRWERENRSQLFGKATAVSCSVTHAFYKFSHRLFLLPAGEGQDEGENVHVKTDGYRFSLNALNFAILLTSPPE